MKGLAVSAKSATSSTIGELVSQFNDLRTQIANLARDTQFQGLNLINGTGEKADHRIQHRYLVHPGRQFGRRDRERRRAGRP